MAGVNKVILVGNLGADPEIRTLNSGDKVASFSLATSETWRDKSSGERKERTEWHRISIFSQPLATIAETYLTKGATVYLEGQLQTRKWTDQAGIERYTTEVVLKQFTGSLTMIGGKREGSGPPPAGSPDDYGHTRTKGNYGAQSEQDMADKYGLNDEIPF